MIASAVRAATHIALAFKHLLTGQCAMWSLCFRWEHVYVLHEVVVVEDQLAQVQVLLVLILGFCLIDLMVDLWAVVEVLSAVGLLLAMRFDIVVTFIYLLVVGAVIRVA